MSLLITGLVNTQSGDIGCFAKKPLALQPAAAISLNPKQPISRYAELHLGHFLLRAVSIQQLPLLILTSGYQSTHTQTKPAEKAWPCRESPPPQPWGVANAI